VRYPTKGGENPPLRGGRVTTPSSFLLANITPVATDQQLQVAKRGGGYEKNRREKKGVTEKSERTRVVHQTHHNQGQNRVTTGAPVNTRRNAHVKTR